MLLPSWLSFPRPASRPSPTKRRQARRRPTTRLHVEPLEDRCLLAADLGATLVADIVPGSASSNPQYLTNVNGTLFFGTVTNGGATTGLWKSDGTTAGTVLVKGDLPGSPGQTQRPPFDFTPMAGSVFFSAGSGLWKTDGTTAGTVLVKSVIAANLTPVNGKLFFAGYDGKNGSELWVSDGTAAGTVLVKDIYPGTTTSKDHACGCPVKQVNSSGPASLTNLNGTLFFSATNNNNGRELWRSDGTEAGTTLVKNIAKGSASSSPEFLMVMGGVLYFGAEGVDTGGLWKSDGTAAGTVRIKAFSGFVSVFHSFESFVNASFLTNVNGTIFFTANDGIKGPELWKSDGTPAGTVLVKDILPGNNGSIPGNGTGDLTNVNGTLYFGAVDGTNGRELWKSDGTAAGTVLVKDINPGSTSSYPSNLTNVNGRLYLAADDGASGREPWQSDGTAVGTVLVRDIYAGSTGSDPGFLTGMNNKLYFAATDPTHGRELWDPPPVAGNGMTLVGNWDGHNHQYADLWAETVSRGRFKGRTFAYLGHYQNQGGVDIIDITDPRNPTLASTFVGTGGDNEIVDVQVQNGIGFFASWNKTSGGIFVVDVSNPYAPRQLARIDPSNGGLHRVHTLFVDGAYLYEVNVHVVDKSPEIRVFDISNPASPTFVRGIRSASPEGAGPHEVTVRNGRLYAANVWEAGYVDIFDVSKVGDVTVPVPLLGRVVTGMKTHTAWPTDDGQFVVVAREWVGAELGIWNVSNPAKPTLASAISLPLSQAYSPHQPVVVGNLLYVAWFEAGVRVYNIADPYKPLLVGDYDTYTGPYGEAGECAQNPRGPFSHVDVFGPTFGCGAWGVYPFLGNDRILVSDFDGGLFIVSLDPPSLTAAATAAEPVDETLRADQVQPLLTEAIARWQGSAIDTSSLSSIDIRIADLPGATLGEAVGHTIWLDDNAAGWGWFVDATPWDDSEFTTLGNQGEQGRMDLLTVLEHEIGHLLGHDHAEDGVMIDTLPTGTRRVPNDGITTATRLDGSDLFLAFLDADEESAWIGGSLSSRGRAKR